MTLSGDVTRGGVFEVPVGTPIATVLRTAGSNESFSAVLLGGYYGTWLGSQVARTTTLDKAHLQPVGSGVGCGAIVVLPGSACGLRETADSHLARGPDGWSMWTVCSRTRCDRTRHDRPRQRALDAAYVTLLHRWAAAGLGLVAHVAPDGAVRLSGAHCVSFADDVGPSSSRGACLGHYAYAGHAHSGAFGDAMALRFMLHALDPIACDGRGVCAELLPERIQLDDLVYLIIDETPIDAHLFNHARRCVDACPVLALRLEPSQAWSQPSMIK